MQFTRQHSSLSGVFFDSDAVPAIRDRLAAPQEAVEELIWAAGGALGEGRAVQVHVCLLRSVTPIAKLSTRLRCPQKTVAHKGTLSLEAADAD